MAHAGMAHVLPPCQVRCLGGTGDGAKSRHGFQPGGRLMLEAWVRLQRSGVISSRGMDTSLRALRQRSDAWAASSAAAFDGLRGCGLPGCSARETGAGQFKICAACKQVAYCSKARPSPLHGSARTVVFHASLRCKSSHVRAARLRACSLHGRERGGVPGCIAARHQWPLDSSALQREMLRARAQSERTSAEGGISPRSTAAGLAGSVCCTDTGD